MEELQCIVISIELYSPNLYFRLELLILVLFLLHFNRVPTDLNIKSV